MVYDLETVGGRIRWALNKAGLNQSEFARRIGTKVPVVNRWINNEERGIADESLDLVAAHTGVPVAWLKYGGDPETEPVSRAERSSRAAVLRQIDMILAVDTPGSTTDKLEAVAAVWRGYALAREADAAVRRARAAVSAEAGAAARARTARKTLAVRPVRDSERQGSS